LNLARTGASARKFQLRRKFWSTSLQFGGYGTEPALTMDEPNCKGEVGATMVRDELRRPW
jgi:hypothetical protein